MILLSFIVGIIGGVLIGVVRKHNKLVNVMMKMTYAIELESNAIDRLYKMMEENKELSNFFTIIQEMDDQITPVKKAKKPLTKKK
jgi:hypothetical protein